MNSQVNALTTIISNADLFLLSRVQKRRYFLGCLPVKLLEKAGAQLLPVRVLPHHL